jgi:hypothetical protein
MASDGVRTRQSVSLVADAQQPEVLMLTIKTTGDDAWQTDAILIDALRAAHVTIEGKTYEIIEATDVGEISLRPVVHGIASIHDADIVTKDAHNITIEVL